MGYSVASTDKLNKPILQALTTVSSTKMHPLGYEVTADTGEVYRYGFLSTTMTAATRATYPAFAFENITQEETITTTHDGDLGRSFVGVLCAIAAAGNNYLWYQKDGVVPSCNVSTSVAAIGDTVACFAAGQLGRLPIEAVSTSLAGVTYDLATVKTFGTALQAASGGMADVQLHGV